MTTVLPYQVGVAVDAAVDAKGWGCSIGPSSDRPRSDLELMALLGVGAFWLIRGRGKRPAAG